MNCKYCGKPAGLFSTYHAQCRTQYELAVRTIPAFFEKALRSTLPADRFSELLQTAAAASFVKPDQLESLARKGIAEMIDAVIEHHLITPAEEDRILELADSMNISLDDVHGAGNKLIKTAILRELDAGAIPERVEVVDPLPLELEPGEIVIWIFNGVKSYRSPRVPKDKALPPPKAERIFSLPDYYPPSTLDEDTGPLTDLVEEGVGDLIVTNRRLILIWADRQRAIPYSRVSGFRPRRNGLQIMRGSADDRVNVFALDDPWFASNLVVRMLRSAAVESMRPGEQDFRADPAEA